MRAYRKNAAAAFAVDGLFAAPLQFPGCRRAWAYFNQLSSYSSHKVVWLSDWEETILLEAIQLYEEVVVNGLSV